MANVLSYQTFDPAGGVATSRFSDSIMTTGWGVLEVETNRNFSDSDQVRRRAQRSASLPPRYQLQLFAQMYAAGYAEGFATQKHIIDQYWNMMVRVVAGLCLRGPSPHLMIGRNV